LTALMLSALGGVDQAFAPKAEPWPRWQAHDAASARIIEHAVWQNFLDRYVADDGTGLTRVAYGRVTPEDRRQLDGYLSALSAQPIAAVARPEQMAFWINLYNALTVRVVLDHYPVASIRDIDLVPGLLAGGPWDKKLLSVDGEPVSLNDIEHRILRPIWGDNRVHYAVNCAAVGCPKLQTTAFSGANLERLLDQAARAYVNSPRGARIDRGRMTISKIYSWYVVDFGNSEAGVIAHLQSYAAPSLKLALTERRGRLKTEYDWSLNDQR
jgi:hypothetical protein